MLRVKSLWQRQHFPIMGRWYRDGRLLAQQSGACQSHIKDEGSYTDSLIGRTSRHELLMPSAATRLCSGVSPLRCLAGLLLTDGCIGARFSLGAIGVSRLLCKLTRGFGPPFLRSQFVVRVGSKTCKLVTVQEGQQACW